MTELVKLSPQLHAGLKVAHNCALELAKKQHMTNLRVNEVCYAVSSFPAFITRRESSGDWVLCAVMAFEPGKNLFVENDAWQAVYQPTAMQTYPFQLMQSADDEKQYTIGIDENNEAFSAEEGAALFDSNDQATPYLSQVSALLEANIKNDILTYQFTRKLDQLGLVKSVDVLVDYASGAVHTLKGLHTIDEDKLQSLPAEQFEELRKQNYLAPIYAMLISLFQLNLLLRKHNGNEAAEQVTQVRVEVAKDSKNQ